MPSVNVIALKPHLVFMHPDIGNIDPHFADIADRTARVGDIQPLGDVERRPLTAADQQRKDPKFVVVPGIYKTML